MVESIQISIIFQEEWVSTLNKYVLLQALPQSTVLAPYPAIPKSEIETFNLSLSELYDAVFLLE